MKAILSLAMLAVGVSGVMAQAHIKAVYTETSRNLHATDTVKSKEMTLVSGLNRSFYFNEMSQYCDSMESTPEGKKKLQEVQLAAWMTTSPDGSISIDMRRGNAPRKTVYTYVEKDFANGNVTVYDKWGGEQGVYSEPLHEQEWTITGDSVKTVLGYDCVLAECDYHGRHWRAWFSPEIPVQDGPWKLGGLPGLILSADGGNSFTFEIKGLENYDGSIGSVYNKDSYQKVDRKKALENEEYYANNMESVLRAQGVTLKMPANATPPKFEAHLHSIEPDYK